MIKLNLNIAILLLGCALPALGQAPPVLEWGSLPEALADAATTKRPTLVYVHAAWCAPCRRLERETFADPAVAARLGRFARAKLTFDDYDRTHRLGDYRLSEAAWAARLGAETTPALIVLAPDGSFLTRQIGFLPPAGLLAILDAALTTTTTTDAGIPR